MEKSNRKNRFSAWLKAHRTESGIILVLVVLLSAALLWPKPVYPEVSEARLMDDPSLGPADAPVTIIEYADFACPGCKLFHDAEVMQAILEKYDGQVRFVWRDNARISPGSKMAANAAQCAYDQGAFWEYHDLLFDNQDFSNEALKGYASQLGLNRSTFDTCLDENTYYNKILYSMKLAGERGLSVTPAFLINGELIIGPPPVSTLSDYIEKALTES